MLKKLEQGEIPFRTFGTKRLIRLVDLRRYKCTIEQKRATALDELAAQAQKLGMGY